MKFYYENKEKGKYRVYDSKTEKFEWVEKLSYKHEYFIFDDYESTDEGILKYRDDFLKWTNQLKNNDVFKIDYLKYGTHDSAVEQVFFQLVDKAYEDFDELDYTEFKYQEKCNKSAIIKLICEKETITESYGYDFSLTYPFLLGDKDFRQMPFPTKRGKEYKIDKFDENLQIGYYHVIITSNDKDFNKVFNYSSQDWYCHSDIFFAQQCVKKNGSIINIELVKDGDYNAYLYGEYRAKNGIIATSKIFNPWYKPLSRLRDKFKDNALIKHLLSSCWGHICGYLKKNLTAEEIEEQKLCMTSDKNDPEADYYKIDQKFKGDRKYYVCLDAKKPYKYGKFARIKQFLLSRSRCCTANIALLYPDDIVRIHTDCVVFNKEHDDVRFKFQTYPFIKKEGKTTGKILWHNVNNYEKV